MTATISALYFDGKTARPHHVAVGIDGASVQIKGGDVERSEPIGRVSVSQRLTHAPRAVAFADGASLEVADNPTFDAMLAQAGHVEARIDAWQRDWRAIACFLGALVLFALWGYRFGVPMLASHVADSVPARIPEELTALELRQDDRFLLSPSRLPAERQKQLSDAFRALIDKSPDHIEVRLVFRSSPLIGPNAFCLPDGTIVLLDQLVSMLDNDEQVLAVLSHEAGHAHYKHALRGQLESAAIGVAMFMWIGDTNWLMATLPTVALQMKYSREFESEADAYGAGLLRASGIPPARLAEAFERFEQYAREQTGDTDAKESSGFLDSHPTSHERIEALKRL